MDRGPNSTYFCATSFLLPIYNLALSQQTGIAFLSVVNALLACPTFVANFLVLLVIWKKPSVRCNAIYLLGFLAITDVLVGLTAQPLFVAYAVQVLLYKTPSCFVMVTYDLLSFLLCFWSATTSLIVTVDRCAAVLYPYKYATFVRARRLIVGVVVTWLAWFLYVVSRVFGSDGRTFALVRSSLFLVSIVVTSAVYIKMVLISRRHAGAIAAQNAAHGNEGRERKALKTALFVVGAYILSYFPLTVCLQIFFLVRPPKQTRFVSAHWCTTLVFIDSLLNPIIYWWRIPRMRTALLELFNFRSPEPIFDNNKNTLEVHSARNSTSIT